MYTLDTNAVIYYTAGDPTTVSVLEEIFGRPNPIYLSAISEIELFGYPSLGPEEAGKIGKFLEGVSLIALDSRIARIAASLRREYSLGLADSAIAATALFTGSTLLTRNVRDFRRVAHLKVQKL